MHFELHQVRSHERVREADEYRLAQQKAGLRRTRASAQKPGVLRTLRSLTSGRKRATVAKSASSCSTTSP